MHEKYLRTWKVYILSSFWEFPPCAKYDELIEGRHDDLIHGALQDSETGIEKIDRHTYILYGKKEALLLRPVGIVYRFGVELLGAFLNIYE